MLPRSPWRELLILVALMAIACDSQPAPPVQGTATPSAAAPSFRAVLAATQFIVGEQRFPLGVLDHNTPVNDATVRVTTYSLGSGGTAMAKGVAAAPFKGEGLEGRGLYVAHLTFDSPGQWLAEVSVTRPGAAPTVTSLPFQVAAKGTVPGVGDPAPRSRNLTAADVPDVSYIDSGHPPDDMHQLSIADAIAAHRTTLVVFATPAFCSSATCGPQVHAVQPLEPEYAGRLVFIHCEIYRDFKPDPARRQLSPTVQEWHLQSEPWVFLIDRGGVVRAAFESTAATDEIRAAIDALLASGG